MIKRIAAHPLGDRDIIVLTGAPGSGKSTLGAEMKGLDAVLVEQWVVRSFHLPFDWTGASLEDERLATEAMAFLAEAYTSRGRQVVLCDVRDEDAIWLHHRLGARSQLVSLVADDAVIAIRVAARTGGFMDPVEAVARNRALADRALLPAELRMDTSYPSASAIVS